MAESESKQKAENGGELILRQQDTIGRDVAMTAFTNNSHSKRAYPSNGPLLKFTHKLFSLSNTQEMNS